MKSVDYSIYLVTDRDLITGDNLLNEIEESLIGGTKLVQLREKNATTREFLKLATELKELCHRYNAKLLINDRIDIALAINADGVHLGQTDMPADIARKILGEDKIIGVSTQTIEMAKEAESLGADYIGVGAVFPTQTKDVIYDMNPEILSSIAVSVSIPVVAIGGINRNTIDDLKDIDVAGYAVVTGILMAEDKKSETEYLLNKYRENTRSFNAK
ncbi:Thiamine-phosphate synthase [Peptoniphilus indolicus]|uniref:Thiamine-phosphate synthase n=2 Tax=Peptoniphilus indolicus TaxID=33030 RepID=G4D2W3_9FIRM|nr:thiamine phosphate synthase [Peptoniphilus indolicus]EGY80129.1 thiamine-phosphate diphosphorylase [Peptoniphilus indolicus ATCC 29427]SUB75171.1 Thiamine-phosphate synthase [Peptoniphilus indolicus]